MPPVAKVRRLQPAAAEHRDAAAQVMARLIGAAHQACRRLNPSVTAMAAAPVNASLTVSHRILVTLWFQVSRTVPVSHSRAISGRPRRRR